MNEKIKNIIFMLILGSVCIALLLGVKAYTYPIIAHNAARTLKTTILEAAEIPFSYDDFEEVFKKNIRVMTENGTKYYLTPANFYIFEFEGRGLWGPIKGVVTLNRDLETIENIRIIAQEETPGLGGRIEEESFLDQFRNKKVAPVLVLILRRKGTANNEIDAISGASITSEALINMINESVKSFREKVGK